MTHQFFMDKKPHKGLTYQQYTDIFQKKVEENDTSKLNEEQIKKFETTKLNFQRTSRINRTYVVNNVLCSKIKEINQPQIWMMITEDWCGDSAQTIPYIAKIVECNPLIDLRIILRDQNPEIMDNYLTNGSRSIPKLVAFDMDGNELFQWGPRPQEAQELVNNAKAEGKSKEQFLNELHLWYGRNRGKNLEEEFMNILEEVFLIPHN